MDELHRNRSFADSGSYPLHRTVAHVADGKETGNIGLQQEGIAVERPSFGALPVSNEIGACQEETALVALDQSPPANRFAAGLQ